MEQDLTELTAADQESLPDLPSPEDYIAALVRKAKGAAGRLSTLPTAIKNQALQAMADGLEGNETELLAEPRARAEQ